MMVNRLSIIMIHWHCCTCNLIQDLSINLMDDNPLIPSIRHPGRLSIRKISVGSSSFDSKALKHKFLNLCKKFLWKLKRDKIHSFVQCSRERKGRRFTLKGYLVFSEGKKLWEYFVRMWKGWGWRKKNISEKKSMNL